MVTGDDGTVRTGLGGLDESGVVGVAGDRDRLDGAAGEGPSSAGCRWKLVGAAGIDGTVVGEVTADLRSAVQVNGVVHGQVRGHSVRVSPDAVLSG